MGAIPFLVFPAPYSSVAHCADDACARIGAGDEVVAALDRGLLRQAIGNLVMNSLNHTPPGGEITLAARLEPDWIRIEVSDTGAGISARDLPRVFDRFYRADKARSSPGSVGLGLAIVKGIATLHGGRAEIESEVGRGTRIILALPAGTSSPECPRSAQLSPN